MPANPVAYVLDSFAVLAYLEGESGQRRVQVLFEDAQRGALALYLSVINLGEVMYIVEREQGLVGAQRALAALDQLPIQSVPVSRATVMAAAHLKARYAMSYADAFAVVAAQDHGAVLVTGDPEFKSLVNAGVVQVEWIPRR
ncbi:MAG: type II toxin-antitoxin system VapC family toxin [Anaerolineales bacterium]